MTTGTVNHSIHSGQFEGERDAWISLADAGRQLYRRLLFGRLGRICSERGITTVALRYAGKLDAVKESWPELPAHVRFVEGASWRRYTSPTHWPFLAWEECRNMSGK